jgi:hypothetical protein
MAEEDVSSTLKKMKAVCLFQMLVTINHTILCHILQQCSVFTIINVLYLMQHMFSVTATSMLTDEECKP